MGWWAMVGNCEVKESDNFGKIGGEARASVEGDLVTYLLRCPEAWVGAHTFGILWGAVDLRIRSWSWFLNRCNREFSAAKNARLKST